MCRSAGGESRKDQIGCRLHKLSNRILSNPPERETCEGDAYLACRDVPGQVFGYPKQKFAALIPGLDEGGNTRTSDADQGELRADKKGVGQDEDENSGQFEK